MPNNINTLSNDTEKNEVEKNEVDTRLSSRLQYEVSTRQIIKSDLLLGSGNFGEVWLGHFYLAQSGPDDPNAMPIENNASQLLKARFQQHRNSSSASIGQYNIPVAVKTTKQDCINPNALNRQKAAILAEIDILCTIGQHDNVLQLIGAVTNTENLLEFCMFTEYCMYGSLDKFLVNKKSDGLVLSEILTKKTTGHNNNDDASDEELYLTEVNSAWHTTKTQMQNVGYVMTGDLLSFAFQIADGMRYLHCKKIIHRDLALRNILLSDRRCVKIADFGLSRQVPETGSYLQHSTDAIPAPWTAPEAIRSKTASVESDYWTFGILLWELFYLGAKVPYSGLGFSEMLISIENGYRLEPPPFAPRKIYIVMQQLWHKEPSQRMTLDNCRKLIGDEFQRSMNKGISTFQYSSASNFYLTVCEESELYLSTYLKERLTKELPTTNFTSNMKASPPSPSWRNIPKKIVKLTFGNSRLTAVYFTSTWIAIAIACVFAGLYFASIKKRTSLTTETTEYRYFDVKGVFVYAAYECFVKNGYPPFIRDEEENQFILEQYLQFSHYQKVTSNFIYASFQPKKVEDYEKQYFWLGAQRIGKYYWNNTKLPEFKWIDDKTPMNYTNWRRWEPNQVGDEGCVVMDEEGKWYDVKCDQQYPFICVYQL